MSLLAAAKHRAPPEPPRILIYGEGGLGKTTLAAAAPDPIVMCWERGAENLDVDKLYPQSLAEGEDMMGALYGEEHGYRTLVVDSVDWLETVMHRDICTANNWTSIEAPGYGKGYKYVLEHGWPKFLMMLDALRTQRGMGIVLIAHAKIKRFEDPMHGAYERYEPKLYEGAWKLLTEWADLVGFIMQQKAIVEQKVGFDQKVTRATTTGRRVLMVEQTPAAYAKNRYGMYGMPSEIVLPWPASWPAIGKFIPHYTAAAAA